MVIVWRLCGGRVETAWRQERTEAEWRELLTDAGYADIAICPTGTPFSIIEATVR
jgi:hypothetical protein